MPGEFEPIDPWPCQFICDVSTESPTATGIAVRFATDVLWGLTGQRFGFTSVKLRPYPNWERPTPYPDGWLSWPGTQPPPLGTTSSGGGWMGYWFTYGECGSHEVKLPAPVHSVTEVKIDGVVVTGSAYRLDDKRFVTRIDGGVWPQCNTIHKPDDAVGTWTITAQYGESVPDGAALACGELACEVLKAMNGEECRLPKNVTQLARQGVTISMPDPSTLFEKGLTGLFITDLFINNWNPTHLRSRARVYAVDGPQARRTGT